MKKHHHIYAIIALTIIAIITVSTLIVVFAGREKTEDEQLFGVLFKGKLEKFIEEKSAADALTQRLATYKILINSLSKGTGSFLKVGTIDKSSAICQKAIEIAAGKSVLKDKIKAVSDYIHENIKYDFGNIVYDTLGKPRIKAKKTPHETFEVKKALCGEQAELFVYMAGCLDIEAFQAYGGGHAWTIAKSESIVEIDTTTGCFECGMWQPIIGVCDAESCIKLEHLV